MEQAELEAILKSSSGEDVQTSSEANTLTERFNACMHYKKGMSIPNFEFGYWNETMGVWHEQGLPKHVTDEASAYKFFGIENHAVVPVNTAQEGGFEWELIEEDDRLRTYVDPMTGATAKINKEGHKSIPHFIDFKLKGKEDLDQFLAFYDPNDPKRFSEDWLKTAKKAQDRGIPVGVFIGSLMGVPRNYMGFEDFAMNVIDEPELLEELIEQITVCVETTIKTILKDFTPDFGFGWEDVCFNSGPMVTREFMEEIVVPRYKRITGPLNEAGCNIINTDCDGLIHPISDLFLEGGINTMFPVEIHAKTDPVELREKHGKDIRFWGGMDKMFLLRDKKAIETEMLRLKEVVDQGGFIPTIDHRVQADALLENYVFYLELKRDLYGVGGPEPEYRALGWGKNGLG